MSETSEYHAFVGMHFEDFNRGAPISVDWNDFIEAVDILYRKRMGAFPNAEFEPGFVKEICVSIGKSYIDDYHDYLNKGDEEHYNSQMAELLADSLERLFESAKTHSRLSPVVSNIFGNRFFYRRTVFMLEQDDKKRGGLHESDTYDGAFEKLCSDGTVLLIEHGESKLMDVFKMVRV